MEYLLPCECGQSTRVTRAMAGQEITCACGKTLEVPTLRGFGDLAAAEDSAPQVVEKNHWAGMRGILFAICGVLAIYASWETFKYAWNGSLLDTSVTVEDYLEDTNTEWATYGPLELSNIWEEMGEYALETKSPPNFFRVKRIVEKQQQYAIIAGTLMVLLWSTCFLIWWTTPTSQKISPRTAG